MKFIFFSLVCLILSCAFQVGNESPEITPAQDQTESCLLSLSPNFKTGADQIDSVVNFLRGKKVGLVGNPSSQIAGVHLVDVLLEHEVALQRIFCPEHGFRGEGAAGSVISDSTDEKTGLPISSIYGKNKKPSSEQLKDLDILVFDIQDVGARFYTYISTLHYIMEAAAENGVEVLVLDRPNPNGHVIDGPILDTNFKSFIGMHPIPVCHGMTIGEYALMINGEKWLTSQLTCQLSVIPCLNYTHHSKYELPVKPSPNLPSYSSIILYPSLCFFEGTSVSVGRGTDRPFDIFGHPKFQGDGTLFKPTSRKEAPSPKLENIECKGYSFSNSDIEELVCTFELDITELLKAHEILKDDFFSRPDFFDLLAGSDSFRKQILAGNSESEIKESWKEGLSEFKKIRTKYLIYP